MRLRPPGAGRFADRSNKSHLPQFFPAALIQLARSLLSARLVTQLRKWPAVQGGEVPGSQPWCPGIDSRPCHNRPGDLASYLTLLSLWSSLQKGGDDCACPTGTKTKRVKHGKGLSWHLVRSETCTMQQTCNTIGSETWNAPGTQ